MPPKRQELLFGRYYLGRNMQAICNAKGSRLTGKRFIAMPMFVETSGPRLKVQGLHLGDIETLGAACEVDSTDWSDALLVLRAVKRYIRRWGGLAVKNEDIYSVARDSWYGIQLH